jgi:hypothetical protein
LVGACLLTARPFSRTFTLSRRRVVSSEVGEPGARSLDVKGSHRAYLELAAGPCS